MLEMVIEVNSISLVLLSIGSGMLVMSVLSLGKKFISSRMMFVVVMIK